MLYLITVTYFALALALALALAQNNAYFVHLLPALRPIISTMCFGRVSCTIRAIFLVLLGIYINDMKFIIKRCAVACR
jgi:hypothetical protein